jgi:hypothetical protein
VLFERALDPELVPKNQEKSSGSRQSPLDIHGSFRNVEGGHQVRCPKKGSLLRSGNVYVDEVGWPVGLAGRVDLLEAGTSL